jgi:succinate-semialdehyde dehydrogenase / glutarate-semialdehyde dehydrogenase
VLELGSSDPFILLEDAPMIDCVSVAMSSRFIVVQSIQEIFCAELVKKLLESHLRDPTRKKTEVGPLA